MKKFLYLGIFLLSFSTFACSNDKEPTDGDKDLSSIIPEDLKDVPGIEKFETSIDYSNNNFWIARPENPDKDIDVIYYYPTAYFSDDITKCVISDIDDDGMITKGTNFVNTNCLVFSETCNVFAPLYRQSDVSYAAGLDDNTFNSFMNFTSSQDPTEAIDFYFENLNNGRPFILAGHSQGSATLMKLLENYFSKHPEYLDRMVAAYSIGFSVTKEFLDSHKYLKFAENANDTGVIVSWNTEGPGNKNANNFVVEKGAVSINPLNWKRDETYAPISENLGSYINGQTVVGIADAQLDLERGVVVVTSEEAKKYVMAEQFQSIFGPESYHGQDYGFFQENLKKNVGDRINAYKNK
ncbi:MAG: DUF3089 domain-containing protein [Muribaculaceae bacterium]|nr:DUF3089 domain-containing protein [Muribaculaceae bacterium]